MAEAGQNQDFLVDDEVTVHLGRRRRAKFRRLLHPFNIHTRSWHTRSQRIFCKQVNTVLRCLQHRERIGLRSFRGRMIFKVSLIEIQNEVPQEGEFAIRDKLCIMKARITKKISKIKMAEKKLFTENDGFQTLASWAILIKLVLEDLPMEDDPFIVEPHVNDINRGVGDLLGIDQQLSHQFGEDVLFRILQRDLPGLEFVQDGGTLYVPINRNPLIGKSLRQLTKLRMELRALRLEQETMENQLAILGAT